MPSDMTRPELDCESCGDTHLLCPGAMACVLVAFQLGLMQTVGSGGELRPKCLLEALTMDEVVKVYRYRSIDARTIVRRPDNVAA